MVCGVWRVWMCDEFLFCDVTRKKLFLFSLSLFLFLSLCLLHFHRKFKHIHVSSDDKKTHQNEELFVYAIVHGMHLIFICSILFCVTLLNVFTFRTLLVFIQPL